MKQKMKHDDKKELLIFFLIAFGVVCIIETILFYELLSYIIIRLIHTICFAVFLAWAYMRTNNIWVCIFIHYINNTVSFILPVKEYSYNPIWSNIVNISISVILLLFIFSKEFKSKDVVE